MTHDMSRRELITYGSATVAGLAILRASALAGASPLRPGEEILEWLDQPPPFPDPEVVANQQRWEDLSSWLTPNHRFFSVAHYDRPVIDPATWELEIGGMVERPMRLKLAEILARPRQEVVYTLECSGNHGFPFFTGGIGTARWGGTPLAPLLTEAGPDPRAVEVVFWGSDSGEEEVRDITMRQKFARSLSLAEAMSPGNLLCYEMNGAPLPIPNGFPVRLIAPGHYGIANVKWLERIELRDRRFMGRFMARDYVTIREERRGGESIWMESGVGPALLKSAPARVTRQGGAYRIVGAAWGAPIQRVEVQIDDGTWQVATIDRTQQAEHAWSLWSLDWPEPAPGEHTVRSRAIDHGGQMQPAPDDPWLVNKHTYWESNGQITRRIRIT